MTLVDDPPPAPPPPARWRTAEGVELLGRAQGSGLRNPPYLVRRADGQVMQVSELLNVVLREASTDRPVPELAAAVSETYGRRLTVEGLGHLIDTKLAPAGLLEDPSSEERAEVIRSAPLLALTMRRPFIPAPAVRRIAGVLGWLYLPPLVVAALVATVLIDVQLLQDGDLMAALTQVLSTPTMLLALMAMLVVGSIVHELGHATACQYGGARPGTIGVGVYLIFPAFYTDVTDSYRLGRAGRLRTDLGGLYFNVWCLIAAGIGYMVTGNGLLLLFVLLTHLQMLQQLIPAVRLDGYYVLADLAGVPDLFARVRPVLTSMLPGRPVAPRVAELKPSARRLVVAWVLIVLPLLMLGYIWMIWHLPFVVRRTVEAVDAQGGQIATAWDSFDVPLLVLSVLSIGLLVLPLVGIVVLNYRIAVGLLGALGRALTRRARSLDQEAGAMTREEIDQQATLTAADFTDGRMLEPRPPAPTTGWQRAVYVASGRTVNLGPGAKEQRRYELEERLRAPIEGSRRVAVMSRKGGVGKTTMTLALGSTFATLRGDRVIAVDANPDAGNLAHRAATPSGGTVTDVLRDLDRIDSYWVLREYMSQSPESRLEVLASDDDPRRGVALNDEDYRRLIGLLDHFYNLILLDTGTGILDSANQGLLREADELVVVLRPGVDSGRAAALTLDWLDQHGYSELVKRAVVVVNGVRKGIGAPLGAMTKHFEARCPHVVTVPWDPALETGSETRLSSLRDGTRAAMVEMAAALADNFSRGRTRRTQSSGPSPWLSSVPRGRSSVVAAPAPATNGPAVHGPATNGPATNGPSPAHGPATNGSTTEHVPVGGTPHDHP